MKKTHNTTETNNCDIYIDNQSNTTTANNISLQETPPPSSSTTPTPTPLSNSTGIPTTTKSSFRKSIFSSLKRDKSSSVPSSPTLQQQQQQNNIVHSNNSLKSSGGKKRFSSFFKTSTSSSSSSSSNSQILKHKSYQPYYENKITSSTSSKEEISLQSKDLKIEDYYNLTTTQVPNSQLLSRLDSKMVGILGESDIDKCREIIPKNQTFVTGFSLILLTHNTTISNTKKIRTFTSSPVALLLTDKSAFIVFYDTRSKTIQQTETMDLIEIREIHTGYLHAPSLEKGGVEDLSITETNKKKGQFSMRIIKLSGASWFLMTYSPTDSNDVQKERVLTIVATIRSLIQSSQLAHKIETKLENSEKTHIPLSYYQAKSDTIVSGEVYFNLQKFSFIQTKNDLMLKNIAKKEDYSFSIDLISIYECKNSISSIIDGYHELKLSSQGNLNQQFILYLPKLEIENITRNIIRLVTESQDIVDQLVIEGINDTSSATLESDLNEEINADMDSSVSNSPENEVAHTQKVESFYKYKTNSTVDLRNSHDNSLDSEFYLIDNEKQQPHDDSSLFIKKHQFLTSLDNQPTNIPTNCNFIGKSDILSKDEILWLQSFLPIRHHDEQFELQYGTDKHGISIRTFFSRLAGRSPCFLVIKDDRQNVFGAYTSDPWSPESNVHYGSGETFLFKLGKNRKKFSWTRSNDFFMLSKDNFISLGSGNKGRFGLWIDEDLLYGSSNPCETFNNEILSYDIDFKVLAIEVWASVSSKVDSKKQVNATDLFGTSYTYKPPAKRNIYGSSYRGF
ncbi:hypothetical protein CYY_003983 [Polysphondylium violaceum]|uniref:TLDc domain-containing protein n=1 Tax=Polysphondylium violaceum TaxID=133409 RepID=A0A8J4PVY4_9MYCE|nr:hypothetical protein CYY_003983 [Polysphondylium violaceum]